MIKYDIIGRVSASFCNGRNKNSTYGKRITN